MKISKIPKAVTVICLGNICRSPAGEYLLKYYALKSKNKSIQNIKFSSAGLDGGYMNIHRNTNKYLKSYGIDTSKFYSKGIHFDYIKDYDVIYFDRDVSYEAENKVIQAAEKLFKDLDAKVEIRNQARVHVWFEKHFGYKSKPFLSSEEGINSWRTTATAV